MAREQLFEYVIIRHPSKEEKKNKTRETEIIVGPLTLFAESHELAEKVAFRRIPSMHDNELKQIDVLVRPF